MRPRSEIKNLALSKARTLSSKKRSGALFLVAWLSLFSCAKKPSRNGGGADTSVPPPSANMKAEELMAYVSKMLTLSDLKLFSQRLGDVCPRYLQLDEGGQRRAISAFSAAVSQAESRLNSFTVFYEKELGYESIGLYSLSYEDRQGYKCDFSRSHDQGLSAADQSIYQTDRQVDCFLKISRRLLAESQSVPYLRKLAAKDKFAKGNASKLTITQKLSAYWSVLRASNEDGNQRYRARLCPEIRLGASGLFIEQGYCVVNEWETTCING